MTDCAFCNLVTMQGPVDDLEMLRMVVDESEHFLVVLDIAPLTDGHCLIISKFHVPAYVHIVQHAAIWQEFEQVYARVQAMIKAIYHVDPTLFEHGVSWTSETPTCCINHAHLHVVPIEVNVSARLGEVGLPLITKGSYTVATPTVGDTPYLFYAAEEDEGTFYDAADAPSQFLRQIIGEHLGIDLWNWHDYVTLQNEREIRARLSRTKQMFRTVRDGLEYMHMLKYPKHLRGL